MTSPCTPGLCDLSRCVLLMAAIVLTQQQRTVQGQQQIRHADQLTLSPIEMDRRTLPFTVEQPALALFPADANHRLTGQDMTNEPQPWLTSARPGMQDPWFAQVLPEGIVYRSYWAGLHEPRMGLQILEDQGGESYWDPTLGGRFGVFRYGNDDPLRPQGWQLDIEGAALGRLTLDYWRDLESVDFRGGIPLTYGSGNWQFKLAYYHLSSHLGDEYALTHPGSLNRRVNYVRDAFTLGASWYPVDALRVYAEVGYSFHTSGGAEPLEFQFGCEYSQPGITNARGTPFVALNCHLREEHNYGGDLTLESGWLWRNRSGHTLRIGAFYFNGKSSQYQFYNDAQQQLGGGLWYDF
jgi:hypothetical protein